jgi:hypothetical protein
MKTITKEREVKTLNLGESVSFGIDSSDGLAYVFGILRDSLYSDKTKAAIREYSTNAYDQHVACGIPNRPIEVTFPTRFDPYLKIRNFGRGLSKKEINTIYCYYGKSQKRDSNLYNGQLGIGSKSAFAYGENFLINTFIKGKKTSYNAWIDESDIGKITVLSSEKSSEENGTEIVIPVNEYDIDEFIETGKEVFRFFKVKPIIHGLGEDQLDSWLEDIEPLDFEYKGEGWKLLASHRREITASMGNVGYEVDLEPVIKYLNGFVAEANKKGHSRKEKQLQDIISKVRVFEHGSWHFDFEIGEIQMAASREMLQYIKKTNEAIVSKLVSTFDDLHSQLTVRFDGCETMYESKVMFGELNRGSNVYSALRDVNRFPIEWNGEKVDSSKYHSDDDMKVARYDHSSKSDRYVGKTQGSIECSKENIIIENDIGHRRGILLRICPFLADNKVYVVRYPSKKAKANYIKEHNFDAPVRLLSELPEVDPSEHGVNINTASYGSGEYNPKNAAKVVVLKSEEECSGVGRPSRNRWSDNHKNSDFWECDTVDFTKGGVYVRIERYRPHVLDSRYDGRTYRREVDAYDFNRNVRRDFKNLGIDLPVIHGVKAATEYKFRDASNWIEIVDYMSLKVKEIMHSKGMLQILANQLHIRKVDEDYLKMAISIKDHVEEGPMMDLAEKSEEMSLSKEEKESTEGILDVAKHHGVEIKSLRPSHNLEKAVKLVQNTYPLLSKISTYEMRKKDYEGVANYVKAMDRYAN